MKIICLFPLLLLWCGAFCQTTSGFKVVKVSGSVISSTLQRPLYTGDVIQRQEKLRFETKEAYLIVTSPQTGRKTISNVSERAPLELFQLLERFLRPEIKSTSTRHVSMQYIDELQNSMAGESMLILGSGRIQVDNTKMSLSAPTAIKAWYTFQRKTSYRKISDLEGFNLSARYIFGDTIPQPIPKVMIEYFENEADDPLFNPGLLLAAFIPMFVDEDVLLTEVSALLSATAATTPDQRKLEVTRYLEDVYAPVQPQNLTTWMKEKGLH